MVKGVRRFHHHIKYHVLLSLLVLAELKVTDSATFFFFNSSKKNKGNNEQERSEQAWTGALELESISISPEFDWIISERRVCPWSTAAGSAKMYARKSEIHRHAYSAGVRVACHTERASARRWPRSRPSVILANRTCRDRTGTVLESSNTNTAESACNSAIGAALGIRGYTCLYQTGTRRRGSLHLCMRIES